MAASAKFHLYLLTTISSPVHFPEVRHCLPFFIPYIPLLLPPRPSNLVCINKISFFTSFKKHYVKVNNTTYMSKIYDNWERLVAAVLLREELRRVALNHSREPSTVSSPSSSFNSLIHGQFLGNNNGRQLNFNWDRGLAMDYQEMDSRQVSIVVDEMSGKRSYMVGGARGLIISLGRNSQNWKWRFDTHSRFSEVAELSLSLELDIRAKIRTRMLQPRTVYAAYLVFKIAEGAKGLESAKAMIRFVNDEADRDAAKGAKTVHLQQAVTAERGDKWMEVEMGNFYIAQGDDAEVEVRLLEIKRLKTGLIVEGIEFRPTNSYTETPLVSRQYLLTNVWG